MVYLASDSRPREIPMQTFGNNFLKLLVLGLLAFSGAACDYYSRPVCDDSNLEDAPIVGRYRGQAPNLDTRWTVSRLSRGTFEFQSRVVDRWGDTTGSVETSKFRVCRVNGQLLLELELLSPQRSGYLLARLEGLEESGCREGSVLGIQLLSLPSAGMSGFLYRPQGGIADEFMRYFEVAEGSDGPRPEDQVQLMVPLSRQILDLRGVVRECRE